MVTRAYSKGVSTKVWIYIVRMHFKEPDDYWNRSMRCTPSQFFFVILANCLMLNLVTILMVRGYEIVLKYHYCRNF